MEGGFNITNLGATPVVVSGMDGVGNVFASGTITTAAAQIGTIQGTTTVGTGTITTGSIGTATIGTATITALTAGNGTITTTGMLTQSGGRNSSGSVNIVLQAVGSAGAATQIALSAANAGTQLVDQTRDYMLTMQCTTAGGATIRIGSASATNCISTVFTGSVLSGALYPVYVPAGYFVNITGTTAVFGTQTIVSC